MFVQRLIIVLCCLLFGVVVMAQVRLRVQVNSGNSGTVCTDGFLGGAPEPHWRVRVAGQGWTTYPRRGLCFQNTPHTPYDEEFDCPANYPSQVEVCFRAFEDDGTACVVLEDCTETLCQQFPTPAPGTSATYSMTIPNNGVNRSWGTVNFTISATGGFTLPGSGNDRICDAVDLGVLPFGGSVGDNSLSNYGNFCATNIGDPQPPNWTNTQGVWFSFVTPPNVGAVVRIDARNDPANRGDQIDLQLALYRSSNNACNGALSLVRSQHTLPFYSEEMTVNCLLPNTRYYLLVDGFNNGFLGGQEGFFGLQIFDEGLVQAGDGICDAEDLGVVPSGGVVGTLPLSQTNVCATDLNDPFPGVWNPLQPVWYSFIAPPTGHVIIEARSDLPAPFGQDAIDLQLALYGTTNGLCSGPLRFLGASYNPIGFDEDLDVRCLVAGQRYWVMVDGSALNRSGIFGIRVRDGGIPPAPNDEICDAIFLGAPAPGGTVGLGNQNNYCADNILEPIPSNWSNNQGVWYTFIAPPSGKVEVRARSLGNVFGGDPIDLQLAVYDSDDMTCTGQLREVRSQYQGFGLLWDEDMEVECLIPGRLYYILVDGQGSLLNPGLQEGRFSIEVYGDPRDPAAPNDDVCNFIALGNPSTGQVGTVRGPQHGSQNNFCATAVGEPQPSGFTARQTVWYQFIAPSTGNVRIRLESDPIFGGVDAINLQFAVWESSNNSCSGGTWRELISGGDLLYNVDAELYCLEPGRPYFVQVDGTPPEFLGGHEGYFDVRINELPPIPVASNNRICDALALGNPFISGPVGAVNQHNLCADALGDPNPSAFNVEQTVWYTFTTPPTGGPYAVDVIATSSLPWPFGNRDAIDLQLAVWESRNQDSCGGPWREIASSYVPVIFNENLRAACLLPNRTYYIMVDGSFIDRQGYFDIEVRAAPSVPIPSNDSICQAVDLGTVPIGGNINDGVDYFNFCAGVEGGEPSPFSLDQTVWFSFVAPPHPGPNATSDVRVRVTSDPANLGNRVDLQLAVYESASNACTGPWRLLESSNPLFSFNAEVDLTCLQPGRRYWVQVDGGVLDVEGYFRIEVQDRGAGVRPPNDDICRAVDLGTVPNGGQINDGVNYLNLCSGTQAGEPNPSAFGIEQTVWFQFTAPSSGNVTITTRSDPNNLGDAIDLQLAVYQSANNTCSGPFLEIDSRYNPFGFDESLTLECLQAGMVYFIQVDGASGLLGGQEGYFTIRIQDDGGTSNFPYNNNLCDAYDFGVPTGTNRVLSNQSNECANVEFGEPGVGSYAEHTVWYQFTAPVSGRVRIEVQSSNWLTGLDPEVYLFASSNNACNGALRRIESSNLPTALITERIDATCLTAGETYFIQVDGSNLVRQGQFTIRIRDLEPLYGTGLSGDPEPINNYCTAAQPLAVQGQSCFNGNGNFQRFNYGLGTITHNPPFARNCNNNCGETWYQFTMPASGIALVEGDDDAIGPGFPGDFSELTVVAYTGSCNNLTPIACGSGGLFTDVSMEVAAAPGSTVYLQVFNNNGRDDGENYLLCVSEGCGADNCLNALAFPIQPNIPYCFNTASAQGEDVANGAPGYFECGEADNPERSLYYYFVSDCNGSAVTIHVINARSNGNCILGTVPGDGFNISFFQDATPCDNQPDALVDCQVFTSCMSQPINWSQTYTNLLPNTPYIIQIDGGFNFLGGDNQGEIMIETTTNPRIVLTPTEPTCQTGQDGAISSLVFGGLPPLTYLWSNGQTTANLQNLSAGWYGVTVTSANGCVDTASLDLAPPTQLQVNLPNPAPTTCPSACDAQANVLVSGGTGLGTYTYLWSSGGQTTASATGLCAGLHTVTISDQGGCLRVDTVIITAPAPLGLQVLNIQNPNCAQACSGQIQVQGFGGTGNLQYLWSDGQTTALATGLCAGNYALTLSDDNACLWDTSFQIAPAQAISLSLLGQNNPLCFGASQGSVQIQAQGGQSPYTFDLGLGSSQTTGIFTGLMAGNYQLTVSDVQGCLGLLNLEIQNPPVLELSLLSSINLSCYNSQDGQIGLAASGGTPPYTYSLDGLNFGNSSQFNNLGAGQYTVYVRDANACWDTLSLGLVAPDSLTLAFSAIQASDCGLCNGLATLNPLGGTGPYAYLWSSGETTNQASALCSGQAFVTLTDGLGCSTIGLVTIPNTAALALQANLSSPTCFGNCDASISLTAQGGLAPYTFTWADGSLGAQRTNLCAGSYEVTLSDASGCQTLATYDLTQPTALQANISLETPLTCAGLDNATLRVSNLSGGTAPYTYLWSNGQTTAQITGLGSGNYALTLSDASNCILNLNYEILPAQGLGLTALNIQATACDTNNCQGQASVQVNSPTALLPYTYLWTNGQTNATATGLCAGTHTVSVQDAQGCLDALVVVVPSTGQLNLSMQVLQGLGCDSSCQAQALVQATGGTAPYAYLWSNGQTTAQATGLCPAQHWVSVTDANACLDVLPLTLPANPPVQANLQVVSNYNGQDVSCPSAADAVVLANPLGGLAPYRYLWANSATTASVSGLQAGWFSLTLTDAANCTYVDSILVRQPSSIQLSLSPALQHQGFDTRCATSADAVLNAQSSGGTPPYTYLWSNGQTTAQATGLATGLVTLSLTDANACQVGASYLVNSPPPPVPNLQITSNYNGFAISCPSASDGQASALPTGGVGPYAYLWSNGQTTAQATGLAAGLLSLTLTDANGCTAFQTDSLQAPLPPATNLQIISSYNGFAVSCPSAFDGQASALPTGGVGPYAYLWSNGQTTAQATGLAAGLVSLTLTDANGCTASQIDSLQAPPRPQISFNPLQAPICQGQTNGQATAQISQGLSPFTYLWSNGQTSPQATGLSSGNHSLSLSDANGCTYVEQLNLPTPPTLDLNLSIVSNYNGRAISCSYAEDGQALATPSGGTAPYTYLWTHGQTTALATGLEASTYFLTLTDANNCQTISSITLDSTPVLRLQTQITSQFGNFDLSCSNSFDGQALGLASGGTGPYTYLWSNGQTTTIATGLGNGTYALTLSDVNQCIAVDTGRLQAPPPLILQASLNQMPTCFGLNNGQATAQVSGGTAPYTYLWSNGETSPIATSLGNGSQQIQVSDANNCSATATLNLLAPPALNLSLSGQNTNCFGSSNGQATAQVSGGTPPYAYLWSNGQTTTTATGLSSGTHSLSLSDANGCQTTAQITLGQSPALNLQLLSSIQPSCHNSNDGRLSVQASGGTLPYTYLWSNGQTTTTATGLNSGTYTLSLSDAQGCSTSLSANLTQPNLLQVQVQANLIHNGQALSCIGANNGQATAQASGGTAPYTYLWSNGQTTTIATGLSSGTHSLSLSDANGCQTSTTLNLQAPPSLELELLILRQVSCFGGQDGQIRANASGGTAPYTYLWSNGQTTATATALLASSYDLTLTDANGCSLVAFVSLDNPQAIILDQVLRLNPNCANTPTGSLFVQASGGQGPLSYRWDDGSQNLGRLNLGAGIYSLTISDANQCQRIDTFQLRAPNPLSLSFSQVLAPACHNQPSGQALIQASGGSPNYTYVWSNGARGQLNTNLSAGWQQVSVSDANGCMDTLGLWLDNPPALNLNLSPQQPTCHDSQNGRINTQVSGGTPPYTFAWSNGQTTANLDNLSPNLYRLSLSDANGCQTLSTSLLTSPNPLIAQWLSAQDPSCSNTQDGYLLAQIQGGNPPYRYTWHNPQGPLDTLDNNNNRIERLNLQAGPYRLFLLDQNGCTQTLDTSLQAPPNLRLNLQAFPSSCYHNNDGQIRAQANGGTPPYTFTLMPSGQAQSQGQFNNLLGGNYQVLLSDALGCQNQGQIQVPRPDSVLLELPQDFSIELGQTVPLYVHLPVNAPNNIRITWTPAQGLSCTDCFQPLAQPQQTTYYTVQIVGDDNCPVQAGLWVNVSKNYDVFIPNVFSPNQDGINDVFMAYSAGAVAEIEEMLIFDRWGELVHQARNIQPNSPQQGWDGNFKGKPLNANVFVYFFRIRFLDGQTLIFKGDVTLIR